MSFKLLRPGVSDLVPPGPGIIGLQGVLVGSGVLIFNLVGCSHPNQRQIRTFTNRAVKAYDTDN